MSKSTKKKTNSSDVARKVEYVSKSFRLPTEKASGIKQAFINRMHGKTGYTKQEVLKDISFEINKGDFFGIVGRNGSGKSTLLKLISQIYTPDSGKIIVNGSLVPFIELGVGFNPELTGRENVYLNGAMLGFSEEEVDVMYDEIVEFAELHDFMDQKLKNYSSGMQVRLAFSVAIKAQGDILVLDEILAVGDEAFQRKCYSYFAQLKKDKKTVILVTHAMDNITRFCNKAIMIEDGEIIESGSVKTVSERYVQSNSATIKEEIKEANGAIKTVNQFADVNVVLRDSNGVKKKIFRGKRENNILNIDVNLITRRDIDKETFLSILIKNANGEAITRISSEDMIEQGLLDKPRKNSTISMSSKIQNIFGEGEYSIAVSFKSVDRTETYVESEDKLAFSIVGLGLNGYSLRPDNDTELKRA